MPLNCHFAAQMYPRGRHTVWFQIKPRSVSSASCDVRLDALIKTDWPYGSSYVTVNCDERIASCWLSPVMFLIRTVIQTKLTVLYLIVRTNCTTRSNIKTLHFAIECTYMWGGGGRYSIAGIKNSCMVWGLNPGNSRRFLSFPKTSRRVLGSKQPPFNENLGSFARE